MTATYPLPRETRSTSILSGDGVSSSYGPFGFKIFDTADVEVWTKASGETQFTEDATVTVTKTAAATLDTFSIAFAAALPATTEFIVIGKRTHERSTDATIDGILRAAALELELSKQGAVIQELRRDLDRALRPDFDAGTLKPLPVPASGKALVGNAAGDGYDNKTLSDLGALASAAFGESLLGTASSFAARALLAATLIVTSRTALAAAADAEVYLAEGGRSGRFMKVETDISAYVTKDTQQGRYVAFASDPTGASGGYVRRRENLRDIVSWYGAAGDGTTDDTAALDGWARLVEDAAGTVTGEGLLLVPGQTYVVTNWKLPRYSSGELRTYAGCPSGMATIKRKATGGDTAYMVAPAKWVDDVAAADAPMHFQNVVFDGNDACDIALVCRNYQSLHDGCRFINANVNCCKFVRFASDGTTDAGSSMSNSKWVGCHFEAGAATSGALFKTAANGSGAATSDGIIDRCSFQGNAQAPYCVDLVKAEGWTITSNHLYNSTTKDLLIEDIGAKCPIIAHNIIEDGGAIRVNGQTNGVIGPGNSWWEPLQINFTADAANETLTVNGDIFPKDKAGSTNSYIQNTGADPAKVVYSLNNTFFANSAAGGHSSSSTGLFVIVNAVTSAGLVPYQAAAAFQPVGKFSYGGDTELTIASGVITVTRNFHNVDTEGDAASDDLDTINGGVDGMELTLTANDPARTVVMKDGTGNLRLAGDFSLDNNQDTITLIYNGSAWLEKCRSDNGA